MLPLLVNRLLLFIANFIARTITIIITIQIIHIIFLLVFLALSPLEKLLVVLLAEILVLRRLFDPVVKVIGQVHRGKEEGDHGNHSMHQYVCFKFFTLFNLLIFGQMSIFIR